MKDSVAKELEAKKPKLDSKATNTVKESVSHLRKPMVQKQDHIVVQVSGHRCEPCGISFDDDILSTAMGTHFCVICVERDVRTNRNSILIWPMPMAS